MTKKISVLLIGLLLIAGTVCAEYHPGLAHLPNLGQPKGEMIDISFITFSLHVSDYSFFVFDGMRKRLAEFKKPFNVHMSAAGGHGDHEGLLQLVREAIIRGTDFLVVHPTILEMNTAVSELAEEHGVPLVWINVGPRGMLEPEEYPAMSYVGYEHYDGGVLVGEFLADYLSEGATIGALRLFVGDYADERLTGAIDVLNEKRPDVKIIEEYAEGSRDKGNQIATSMITGNPDIAVIYGGNSNSAMGALAAAESLGVNVGVIGYGATGEEVEAILENELMASIMRDPFDNGRIAADIIDLWREGREDEIKPAYATFQKLVYSPDLVLRWVDPALYQDWIKENGEPEITWAPERDIPRVVEQGQHDPEHLADNPWLAKFRR